MIVHCKKEKFDFYIGRPSEFGNPYVIGKHGNREYCITKYRLYLNTRPDLLLKIPSLKGKVLGCWCDNLPCHGDVLLELAESRYISNWFSNMLPIEPFTYQGIVFKTVENFYQAMKLPKDDIAGRTRIAGMYAHEAKKFMRGKNPPDWESKSLDVMRYALKIKFAQKKWRDLLNMTEKWEITEWNNNDRFWGKDINTKEGKNMLGRLIMEIRDGRN